MCLNYKSYLGRLYKRDRLKVTNYHRARNANGIFFFSFEIRRFLFRLIYLTEIKLLFFLFLHSMVTERNGIVQIALAISRTHLTRLDHTFCQADQAEPV